MRFIVALGIGLILVVPLRAVETQSSEPSGIESLGRELLDDLTPDVLRQPETPPRNPASHSPHFDDLGEDIGQPSGPLSLTRVRQSMQHAEALLAHQQSAGRTDTLQQAAATQQEVVDQLDKLIAELSKQCQGGQCEPSDQPPKPNQRSQSKPGKSGSSAGRGQTAARDSTTRLDGASADPVDKADINALVKDLWGHLPERSREQMLQSFSEEFLPQYELEIEQYYRRLSEEQDDTSPK
ncbi:MAG: hypothetical protein WD738_16875 [Pirellulales bacterium]